MSSRTCFRILHNSKFKPAGWNIRVMKQEARYLPPPPYYTQTLAGSGLQVLLCFLQKILSSFQRFYLTSCHYIFLIPHFSVLVTLFSKSFTFHYIFYLYFPYYPYFYFINFILYVYLISFFKL